MKTCSFLMIPAALACAVLAAPDLSAQTPSESDAPQRAATGLVVGVNVTGSFVTVDGATFGEHTFTERGREGGGGMHLTLGYNFTPTLGVLVHAGGVGLNEDDDRTLGGLDLALRYSFGGPSLVVPYLEMAIGGFALEDSSAGGGSELNGGTLGVAAGLNFFVTRRVAVNADFRYNMGIFATARVDGRSVADDATVGFSTSRVNVGFNWSPMAAR